MEHKFKSLFALVLIAVCAPSFGDTIRSCEIPQITTVVVDLNGNEHTYQDTSRRKFRPDERVRFISNGAYTGYYTVAFIDDGIPGRSTSFLNDPKASFQFPCPSGKCFDLRVSRDVSNKNHDDLMVLYTPCFSTETRDARALKAAIAPQFHLRIPECNRLSKPEFSDQEIYFSYEAKPDHGCVSIKRNGPPTFKVRIDISFR